MKTHSRTEYSLINMATGLAGYAVNTVMGFLCRIVFVRCLSAEYLGVSGLFSNILTMLSLAELGIGGAIAFALYKPIAEKDEKKIASLMRFYRQAYRIVGSVVILVGIAMIPLLNFIITTPPDIKENIYLLYLLYLFNSVVSYFLGYRCTLFTAMQRDYIVKGFNYIITIAQSIFQILYLLLTHEFIGYLLIQIAGNVIYNIWISRKASKDYPFIEQSGIEPLPKQEKWGMLKDVKALAVYKVTGVLVNNTDNLVITYFSGLISVGLASNYTLFSNTLDVLVGQVFAALTGSVGNLNATSDNNTRYRFFKAMNLASFLLYGWGTIGIAFVSSDLIRLFYGSEFVMDFRIPIILAINFYMIGMQVSIYTFKNTLGLFRHGQYVLIFTAAVNLLMDIILGKRLGVFGIYLATAIARLITNTWYEPYVLFKFGFKKSLSAYLLRYISYLGVLGFVGGICCWLCMLCDYAPLINVILKIIICTISFFGVFILVFFRTEEFQYLLKKAKQILRLR